MRKISIPLLIVLISVPGFTQSAAQAGLLKLFPVLFAQAKPIPDASWTPEWPADLPPDAFAVSAGTVSSIKVVAELMVAPTEPASTESGKNENTGTSKPAASKSDATKPGLALAGGDNTSGENTSSEEGSGVLEVAYSFTPRGIVLPVFIAGAEYTLRAELDASGKVRSYAMAQAGEGAGKESGEGAGKKNGNTAVAGADATTTVGLEYDAWGALSRTTMETGDETSFSTFSVYENLVEELAYDAEGLMVGRFVDRGGREGVRSLEQAGEDGTLSLLTSFAYDGLGRISAVGTESGTTEMVYDSFSRPVLIRTVGAENTVSERRLQWDERNLLVREIRRDQDGKLMEFRYEYVFDRYGNWTERRSLVYTERLGAYVPQNGPKVSRIIIYR